MHIPEPARGESTAAILCRAGVLKPWETADQLRTINVRCTSGVKSALEKDGPLLVKVFELEKLTEALEVKDLIKKKTDIGWACKPTMSTLELVASVAVKARDLHEKLLPRLRSQLRNKKRATKVKKRLKLLKETCKKVNSRIRGKLIAPEILQEMFRAIGRVHAKAPTRTPTYLLKKIDDFSEKLLADLNSAVVFTERALD